MTSFGIAKIMVLKVTFRNFAYQFSIEHHFTSEHFKSISISQKISSLFLFTSDYRSVPSTDPWFLRQQTNWQRNCRLRNKFKILSATLLSSAATNWQHEYVWSTCQSNLETSSQEKKFFIQQWQYSTRCLELRTFKSHSHRYTWFAKQHCFVQRCI